MSNRGEFPHRQTMKVATNILEDHPWSHCRSCVWCKCVWQVGLWSAEMKEKKNKWLTTSPFIVAVWPAGDSSVATLPNTVCIWQKRPKSKYIGFLLRYWTTRTAIEKDRYFANPTVIELLTRMYWHIKIGRRTQRTSPHSRSQKIFGRQLHPGMIEAPVGRDWELRQNDQKSTLGLDDAHQYIWWWNWSVLKYCATPLP